mmetsp:Transcript_56864/g.101488  ORF Transcript_56864/g.101488 Transcript_56864/m.101488 type:complete len:101 (+) Transcript_56864:1527-1829(+)
MRAFRCTQALLQLLVRGQGSNWVNLGYLTLHREKWGAAWAEESVPDLCFHHLVRIRLYDQPADTSLHLSMSGFFPPDLDSTFRVVFTAAVMVNTATGNTP